MTQPARFFGLALLLLTTLGMASAHPRYNVIDLGTFGGTSSGGVAINPAGKTPAGRMPQAMWLSRIPVQRRGHDRPRDLRGPLQRWSAINAAGQVTGRADTADGSYHAFLYSDGVMTDLGTLGGASARDSPSTPPGKSLVGAARRTPFTRSCTATGS